MTDEHRRKLQRPGAVIGIGVSLTAVVAIIALINSFQQKDAESGLAQHSSDQDKAFVSLNALYGQVCEVAGGQVHRVQAVAQACERVRSGQPAVPTPSQVTQAQPVTTQGVAIDRVEQDGQCYVNVVLTNHATSRFGPFCGAPGTPGPSGLAGASGQPGVSGANGSDGASGAAGASGTAGTGISDVRSSSDHCFVDVVLTDATTRTVGPFCAPAMTRYTMTLANGDVQNCQLTSDGTNGQPVSYDCTEANPPPSTTSPPVVTMTTDPGGILGG